MIKSIHKIILKFFYSLFLISGIIVYSNCENTTNREVSIDSLISTASFANAHPFLINVLYKLKTEKDAVDINEKNIFDNDNTAIHYAAALGHIGIVNMLVKLKVNINAKNKLHHTPLHLAVLHNKLAVLHTLLTLKELDPNLTFDSVSPSIKSVSPLFLAVNSGNPSIIIIKTLLEDSRIQLNQATIVQDSIMTPLKFAKFMLTNSPPAHKLLREAIVKTLEDKGAKEEDS